MVVGVVETSTAGAAARTDLGALDELVWGFVVDTETGEGLEGAGAALGEGRVADALGVVVADVVGFVAGGGTRVVVADPVIVLAVPVTSDVMDGGEVLTPRAPARCDPSAKRRAKVAMAETRKIPSQPARRGPPTITFSTG